MLPIYLNWAGLAPLTWRGYRASLFAPELFGNVLLPRWFARVGALKEAVGAWLGCGVHQVAFVPSTSIALTIAATSLRWQEGEVALYPEDDFPANVLPWQQLGRFGVRARGMTMGDWDDPWPERTKMVSISTVDFSTGIEQPWREVTARARRAGIWSCVDAIQSAGVKPSWSPDIDFWCAGTQKWLGSGLGLALLVISERALQALTPAFPCWLGLAEPPDIGSGLDPTARAWEMGWTTPQAIARFEANLRYFRTLGFDEVAKQVRERRDYLHERLLGMGWRVVSCPERWSGIVSIDPGPGLAEAIVKDGYRRRIVTARRGPYVRLSAHLFTTRVQLGRAIDWLWHCRTAYRPPASTLQPELA